MTARIALLVLFALAGLLGFRASFEPPNRPPVNALRRVEPKKYEVTFSVMLQTVHATADMAQRGVFRIDEAPIVFPMVYVGQYSRVFVNPEPVGWMALNGTPVPDNRLAKGREENKPFNTYLLRMVVPQFEGTHIQAQFKFVTQTWSAEIDEQAAQATAWPRDMKWPDETLDGLRPQTMIESDNAVFANLIQKKFGNNLQNTKPYMVAKAIVADVLNNFQRSGDGEWRAGVGELKGMVMRGALETVSNPDQVNRWIGSEHDLVCVCIALLRAANIPARPVIGIWEDPESRGRTSFISWGEFYLPESGWVSFDPKAMLGKGPAHYRDPNAAWPEFGTMENLNQRVVLSYHFLPAAAVFVPGNYAVWGWDPRPSNQPSYEQIITLLITSKGRGEEDPR